MCAPVVCFSEPFSFSQKRTVLNLQEKPLGGPGRHGTPRGPLALHKFSHPNHRFGASLIFEVEYFVQANRCPYKGILGFQRAAKLGELLYTFLNNCRQTVIYDFNANIIYEEKIVLQILIAIWCVDSFCLFVPVDILRGRNDKNGIKILLLCL